ncbi:MAG: DM13 domain-containing protein [Pseudomonadota bacterium]
MKLLAGAALAAAMMVTAGLAQAGAGTGSFKGLSNHITTGEVEVVETADGWEIHLKDSFSFDGAPDPRVGFGSAGTFAAGTDFEPLRSDSGAQVYKVPAGIDPSDFNEVYIWCRRFSVPLGVAGIN